MVETKKENNLRVSLSFNTFVKGNLGRDIDLTEFSDQELIDEIQDRDYTVIKGDFNPRLFDELRKDYHAYGFTEKFRKQLEDFFEDMG